MSTLTRSKDRKVTNGVSPNGKTAVIANSFGLPSGKAYSCPGATSVCETVCYAGKLEKIYKGVKNVLINNWESLQNKSVAEMSIMLQHMIDDFRTDSVKRNADLKFRIHWDGDFFSEDYAEAWAMAIRANPDVQFWVYTRSFTESINVLPILVDIPNLAVYLSVDTANIEIAKIRRREFPSVRWAFLSATRALGAAEMKEISGRPGAGCPENLKRIELISTKGSACVSCGICVTGKADVTFSISKR